MDPIMTWLGANWIELSAVILTVVCVYLAVRRIIWTYPIGILGTLTYMWVFWSAQLYSSMALQVFFTAVQVYGWWFWLYGDKGKAPKITRINSRWITVSAIFSVGFALAVSGITSLMGAKMAGLDAIIFSLSIIAQFFMDRKKLENWIVWGGVNIASIIVYGSQGLVLTTILYSALLINAFYGYWAWRKEFRSYTPRVEDKGGITVWAKGTDV